MKQLLPVATLLAVFVPISAQACLPGYMAVRACVVAPPPGSPPSDKCKQWKLVCVPVPRAH